MIFTNVKGLCSAPEIHITLCVNCISTKVKVIKLKIKHRS